MHFTLKKGLSLPLSGKPDQRIETDLHSNVTRVAVLGGDYIGLKPTMHVQVGDEVKVGTPLFEDKKNPGVVITSPASGTIKEINRGLKRALVSVVIQVQGSEKIQFFNPNEDFFTSLSGDTLIELMQASGAWSAFRTRPYGKIPAVASLPKSVFVNAMDTNPLAADPALIINERGQDFSVGMTALAKIGVPVYLCKALEAKLPDISNSAVQVANFSGPHPAGLSSTHIHYIDPVNTEKTVWTIGYQDVIALGSFIQSGQLDTRRYVSIAGSYVNSPRVFETLIGANISEILEGKVSQGRYRVISGSVFYGHHAYDTTDYLGRYDNQISIIEEDDNRNLFGWIAPGLRRFSAMNVFLSSLFKPQSYDITSSQNGSPRAIVPIGAFEKVFPLDLLPTPLLKALLVKDTDSAQELGCLELIEEDLALCTFVDPGKHDFGPVLRQNLEHIEREG